MCIKSMALLCVRADQIAMSECRLQMSKFECKGPYPLATIFWPPKKNMFPISPRPDNGLNLNIEVFSVN